eukprot:UN06852
MVESPVAEQFSFSARPREAVTPVFRYDPGSGRRKPGPAEGAEDIDVFLGFLHLFIDLMLSFEQKCAFDILWNICENYINF